LLIGGTGVGSGYLNLPERTRAAFIPNPFGEGLVYRTGDIVRWLPHGELDYLGRADHQVKIRGFHPVYTDLDPQKGGKRLSKGIYS
jgi:non-ribosomal peptide synthetase component F